MSSESIRAQLAEHAEVTRRVSEAMVPQIEALAGRVLETLRNGGKLLLCGNGGSAADAQHLAAEYVVRFSKERRALAALALATDGSVLTAAGNDLGFERVFERQVRALGRPGDLLLIHSTSGASPNLLGAAEAARACGLVTAALLAGGGGPLRDVVDLALIVPTDSVPRAQEMHLTIGHIVCDLVDRAMAP